MKVQLQQLGASVSELTLAEHEAEHVPGEPEGERLKLLDPIPGTGAHAPFSLTLVLPGDLEDEAARQIHLDTVRWEVVPDAQGRLLSPLPAE